MYRSMASQSGAEGSGVTGTMNGNSADPSPSEYATPASQAATPTSQAATPTSQAATPTSKAATPTSQVTSSSAGSKRKLTSAVWKEMESKI
jgi:hypothetical protein